MGATIQVKGDGKWSRWLNQPVNPIPRPAPSTTRKRSRELTVTGAGQKDCSQRHVHRGSEGLGVQGGRMAEKDQGGVNSIVTYAGEGRCEPCASEQTTHPAVFTLALLE
jgi:hypothetical protein